MALEETAREIADCVGGPLWRQIAPDTVSRLEHAVVRVLRELIEECACAAECAMSGEGTDDPHKALEWAARDIRKLGD